jgi:hypothetical protein
MSNHPRGSAAARITSITMRERTVVLPKAAEDYLENSPSLAVEAHGANPPYTLPDRVTFADTHTRHARSVWLLVVWFVVSVTIIALASLLIAEHFG